MTPGNPFSPPRPVFRAEDLVCFCFHYTRAQIEADVRAHGRSTILERITQEKRAGGCDCVRTNPRRR